MSGDEVAGFLRDSRKLQLGTINPDGTPHMVTMFYALTEGRLAFWTYGKAQKARNIERDPRVSCLVEAGDDYAELRGVLVYGTARLVDRPEAVLEVGLEITKRMTGLTDAEVTPELRGYVEHTARKRVAYVVEPTRVVSWDHRKLSAPATA
ncbi:PPOX class F420-dependent enzyme [Sphaerisporangium melleum]|uniref:PPOX class F420-dependent enzyme n=2 Tax=Sphaerisporangium melleum TaxID=321316 RepID=A0A917VER7_9ACTN|nr:PPOX class F420-dependent enzyme [Sphaerisporangium melleum]GII70139.1 PPOX class F420-dependent enzyme [Sphaerisporangium melleum]